jgi:hypothetical protein
MNKAILIKTSFFLYLGGILLGTYLKITNHSGDTFLMAGLLFMVVFVVAAILEVQRSTRIAGQEKTFWTIGFILSSGFAGIVYMSLVRKRVV